MRFSSHEGARAVQTQSPQIVQSQLPHRSAVLHGLRLVLYALVVDGVNESTTTAVDMGDYHVRQFEVAWYLATVL